MYISKRLIDSVKSHQRKILVWSAVFILLLGGYQFIPFEPTSLDLELAKQIVGKRTSQPILGARIEDNSEIVVTTGWAKGTLSGDGDDYYLRKILWRWWVCKKTHWAL